MTLSPGYQKCQLLTPDSGEWRQLLYIKKTAPVFTCLAYNRYAANSPLPSLEILSWPSGPLFFPRNLGENPGTFFAEYFRNDVNAVYARNQLEARLNDNVCFWPLAAGQILIFLIMRTSASGRSRDSESRRRNLCDEGPLYLGDLN